jgi:hypothetical protein
MKSAMAFKKASPKHGRNGHAGKGPRRQSKFGKVSGWKIEANLGQDLVWQTRKYIFAGSNDDSSLGSFIGADEWQSSTPEVVRVKVADGRHAADKVTVPMSPFHSARFHFLIVANTKKSSVGSGREWEIWSKARVVLTKDFPTTRMNSIATQRRDKFLFHLLDIFFVRLSLFNVQFGLVVGLLLVGSVGSLISHNFYVDLRVLVEKRAQVTLDNRIERDFGIEVNTVGKR